jgi:hypothetical protein
MLFTSRNLILLPFPQMADAINPSEKAQTAAGVVSGRGTANHGTSILPKAVSCTHFSEPRYNTSKLMGVAYHLVRKLPYKKGTVQRRLAASTYLLGDKIRCNKTAPCSNCQIANLPCRASLKATESSKPRPSSIPYQLVTKKPSHCFQTKQI